MYITAIEVSGLRDLPEARLEGLERVVRVAGPSPAATALGDALELLFAALSPAALQALLGRWGLLAPGESPTLTGAPHPEEATWSDGFAGRALLVEGADRHITVDVEIVADPPLFAALRVEAARDPGVVAALAQGGRIRLGVGALFARSWDALAVSLRSLSVGDVELAVRSGERSPATDRLLRELAGRFCRHSRGRAAAALALSAATSRDRYPAYQRWTEALLPDGPRLRAARGPGDGPILLGDELPLRRFGEVVEERASLAASIHLGSADIVWTEADDPWVDRAAEGEDSPLEQVWRVCADGDRALVGQRRPPPPTLPLFRGRA